MEFDKPMVVCFCNFPCPYHINAYCSHMANVKYIKFMVFGTLLHSSLKVGSATGYHWNDIACQLTLE